VAAICALEAVVRFRNSAQGRRLDDTVVAQQAWRGRYSRAPCGMAVKAEPMASTWSTRNKHDLPYLCWCRDGARMCFRPWSFSVTAGRRCAEYIQCPLSRGWEIGAVDRSRAYARVAPIAGWTRYRRIGASGFSDPTRRNVMPTRKHYY